MLETALILMIDINSNNNQQTLSKPISINVVGLHKGVKSSINLIPAEADFGIKFYRTDLSQNNVVEAIWSNVSNTNLCTTISNNNGSKVSTIEHLMSALSGLHIDNLKIEIIINLVKGVSPDVTIDALYSFTNCEISVSPNCCVINDLSLIHI